MVQKQDEAGSRRRGRPPAYDADTALARALDTFWAAGFAGTSLDELSAATGMNRPSLYGAFGDKRALFLKAIGAYRARGEGVLAALTAKGLRLGETLQRVYDSAVKLYTSGPAGQRGCFMIGAALASAVADAEIRAALLEGLTELDRGFLALFARAREQGEIGAQADPEALALMASALLHTLSVRARAGEDEAELRRIAEAGTALILRAAT